MNRFSDTVEWWSEMREWLLSVIPRQSDPETVRELELTVEVCDGSIARLSAPAEASS